MGFTLEKCVFLISNILAYIYRDRSGKASKRIKKVIAAWNKENEG